MMQKPYLRAFPDANGYFGKFGGAFLPPELVEQFKVRKGDLTKRILTLLAPFIMMLCLAFVLGPLSDVVGEDSQVVGLVAFLALFFAVISIPWIVISSHIFKVERIIWIDSYFDKVNLTSRKSWQLARSLFWPSLWLDIMTMLRYYLLPFLLVISVVSGYIYLAATHLLSFDIFVFLLILLAGIMALALYMFYMSIHLRYIRFVFIDLWGTTGYSSGKVFSENKKLLKVTKGADFDKVLASSLGIDATSQIASVTIGQLSKSIHGLGGAGVLGGALINTIGGEAIEVSKDFAKQINYYVFYRIARSQLYGTLNDLNTALYARAGSNKQSILHSETVEK